MRLGKRKRTLAAMWSSALSCTAIEERDASYPVFEIGTRSIFDARKIRMTSSSSSSNLASSTDLFPPTLGADANENSFPNNEHGSVDGDYSNPLSLFQIETAASLDTEDNVEKKVEDAEEEAPSPPLQHSPLVYRFYGKYRSRSPASIPFVLLGPNVDHFKMIGQELAARGFSVIACERVRCSTTSTTGTVKSREQQQQEPHSQPEDGAILIRELLDALKWNRVVLVGCDSESLITVKAAMELAPDRVVGLVLCGDLRTMQDYISDNKNIEVPGVPTRKLTAKFAIDIFLQETLKCPFTVVSALPPGDQTASSSSDLAALESLADNRSVILGGGSAPHRRRPDLFAWVLTRFVEEKILAVSPPTLAKRTARGGQQDETPEPRPLNRLVRLPEFFLSPGSFVVTGRMVATMIFYWSVMTVAIHQFDNVCAGMVNVQSTVNSIRSFRRTVFKFISNIASKLGSMVFIIPPNDNALKASKDGDARADEQPTTSNEVDQETNVTAGAQEPPVDHEKPLAENAPTPPSIVDAPPGSQLNATTSEESSDDSQLEERKKKNENEQPRVERSKPSWKPLFFLDNVVA